VKALFVFLALCACLSAQVGSSKKKDTFTIPSEPIAPSGFDYGRMSEQGELNEYRIGKLEEEVKSIKSTTDFVKGAWWVFVGAASWLV